MLFSGKNHARFMMRSSGRALEIHTQIPPIRSEGATQRKKKFRYSFAPLCSRTLSAATKLLCRAKPPNEN